MLPLGREIVTKFRRYRVGSQYGAFNSLPATESGPRLKRCAVAVASLVRRAKELVESRQLPPVSSAHNLSRSTPLHCFQSGKLSPPLSQPSGFQCHPSANVGLDGSQASCHGGSNGM